MDLESEGSVAWLCSTASIRNVSVRNRVFIPAHASGMFGANGVATAAATAYYKRRIQGGAALMFLGETLVQAEGANWATPISQEKNEPFYEEIAQTADESDVRVFEQLSLQGGQAWWAPGAIAYAPSEIVQPISGLRPASLSRSSIRGLRESFVKAASRAQRCGIHGVEIKADQGKLLYQFLSRRFNNRFDEYGASPERRMRFLTEILEECRAQLGDWPIGVRLPIDSAYAATDEYADLSYVEICNMVLALQERKLVDYVNLSVGTNVWPHGYWRGHRDSFISENTSPEQLRQLKNSLSIPILYAGQFSRYEHAVDCIKNNVCDFVGFARGHIADPDFTRKLFGRSGKDIRPCIRCNQACVGNTWEGRPLSCVVNPETGHEGELSITTSSRQKRLKVAVVGAGPAGLECALIAALHGHSVTLYERASTIGGRLRLAAEHISATAWHELISYYAKQLADLPNVLFRLNTEVSGTLLSKSIWDEVIFATGITMAVPHPFSACDKSKTILHCDHAWQIMDTFSGKRVLIVEEDPYCGSLSLATEIAKRGASVVTITSQEFVGKGLDLVTLTRTTAALRECSVTSFTFCEIAHIGKGGVQLRDLCTGTQRELAVDAVIFGTFGSPVAAPHAVTARRVVRVIGDAAFPRGVEYALLDARRMVNKISMEAIAL